MSAEFFIRIIGMFVFFLFGGYWGFWFGTQNGFNPITYALGYSMVGALFGLVLTPWFTIRPIRWLRSLLSQVSAETLFSGLLGLVMGLVVAALLTFPLSMLPSPFRDILPFMAVLLFSYFGVALFVMRQTDMLGVIGAFSGRGSGEAATSPSWSQPTRTILLDTSVIIDGRVADIAKTGFLPGTLLIPRFVLNELQYIADSADSLRRQRGRRGMEVLSELQKTSAVTVRISDIDVDGVREVDDKLVILARQLKCPILTNDYNLNRVAELQGVVILNINELANAVKSVVLPGETFNIQIIQEGKETNQGVGYMEDGTMVVIENGNKFLGVHKNVTVTKVLQTAAGRMIFARPED
ncbi:MAG: PIN domain nuclease [Chloroflexi bacterium HGW-Chloroflexi-6]|nr:MAG: PIN domain nuclease [Chloroflexi bacterium HGW-Chloroflexi-6]